ncbi:uncharacterized protein LOC130730461 isoform X2 [Lotus japonicus]|uniref:uncharacterized protein LOC130730461 isoform X2 n=1 Tax=Lotus japonicus TaxID=34305 RepID=UPI00258F7C35|nr:uncharacterized protein LOC130730461 isoform X2 [Lotus japonicus]
MAEPPPSLTSLCIDAITQELIAGDDALLLLQTIYDFPLHLLDTLITRLPPLALHKFHHHLPFQDEDEEGFLREDSTKKRKRARDWNLNAAWRNLFKLRWPDLINQIQPTDWQQAYWETHLQNCLDEAAEIALIPSFNGSIGDIQISDSTLKYIGFVEYTNHSTCDHSKLSYHCLQFGSHVSCLRLQNVLFTAEISGLLRECKLQSLVLRWIRYKEQVDEVCKLLTQHSGTLTSLEFVHCYVDTDFINAIFGSLVIKGVQKHGIQHLSIIASSFLEPCTVSLPNGFESFLSSGRSLCSIRLSDNHHGRTFAKALFMTLLNLSSTISVLDLSENRIAGWLSDFNRRLSSGSHACVEIGKSLQQLRVLNLRGNNLRKDDAESLRYALAHMPNLEDLDISDNLIEDEGIRNLIPSFLGTSETGSRISCLKVENCELSCDGVNHLLYALSTSKAPLKTLSVADNYLGSQVAIALGKFLSTPIELLDIGGIGLGSFGFRDLRNLIKEQLKLVKINISENRGGIETAEFLSKLLSQAPQLIEVNAASNLMPIDSLSIICSALKIAKVIML